MNRANRLPLSILLLAFALVGCSDDDPTSPAPDGHLRVPADYATIQDALDAAAPGDTVVVAAGVHTALHEHTDNWGRTFQVAGVLKSGVVVRGATGRAADVIIDPQGAGWGFWAYEVDATALVADLTVRNAQWGISGHTASPRLENCVFRDNGDVETFPSSSGAGLYMDRSESVIRDCVFTGNEARSGGGATVSSSSDVRFEDCAFTDNTATNGGGGLTVGNGSSAVLVDCVFTGNDSGEDGGGLYVHGERVDFLRCTLTGNSATEEGGGVLASYLVDLRFEDSVITGNTASVGGQGCAWNDALVELICCTTDPAGWDGDGDVVFDDTDCGD